MGPRPFGRGRLSSSSKDLSECVSFNGAATFRSRKDASSNLPLQIASCFNGAATFRSRKAAARGPGAAPAQLQWGRDLSVAEGACIARRRLPNEAASMGPRPFGRGRITTTRRAGMISELQWGRDLSVAEGRYAAARAIAGRTASMGPRPFGRGRPAAPTSPSTTAPLQWGRDLSVAEGFGQL